MLCPTMGQFEKFIVEVWELPRIRKLFLQGRSGVVLFNGEVPNTKVLHYKYGF